MTKTWILAAESSRAVLYRVESRIAPLVEVKSFSHPEGREQEQDMTSDRPGRAFDSLGNNRHAMGKEVDPRRQEAMQFSRRLADCLEQGRNQGDYEQLILIAPPEFLGLLRQTLSEQVLKKVSQSLDKNLVQAGEKAIRENLFA
jgi:protein required for attachment to host cells